MYRKYNNKEKIFKKLNLNKYHTDNHFCNHIVGKYTDNSILNYGLIENCSPIDNSLLCTFDNFKAENNSLLNYTVVQEAWRQIPAPKRGELVKRIGQVVTKKKKWLAALITLESGKPYQESLGEVQEWVDICDYAVGLSRQIGGITVPSERSDHRLMEQWHPLGTVLVISAFNFPMAVWAWNTMLSFVCGNPVIWKPSEKTPLCAIACHEVVMQALQSFPDYPSSISTIINGDYHIGQHLVEHQNIALVSATGSVAMGQKVQETVAKQLGKRCLLELGGNNAVIVSDDCDMDLAVRAVVFGVVGTTGQRCTSTRRVIIHENIYKEFSKRLRDAFNTVQSGNPFEGYPMGCLIDTAARQTMENTINEALSNNGRELETFSNVYIEDGGEYVSPVAIHMESGYEDVVQSETFAPIVYLLKYSNIESAIDMNNSVPQGLSSSIITNSIKEAELFMSACGSDCGIVNVNIGTSGAEIGGAFGGEKHTGGGRESGSDAWKQYMRRTTNTINYGNDLPLAQGIEFDI